MTDNTTNGDSQHDLQDYDLDTPINTSSGLRQGLTAYGIIKAAGYGEDALSRPIVGIINTGSGLNPCHANMPSLVEAVKRGIQLQGGLAIEFPTISLHESFASPTSMFLRNLMSMDTEEMIKAQPIDVCVTIGGCDKTTPAQLMGGISANKPIFPLIVGPMMPGSFRGTRIGACTDCRNNWAAYRAGTLDMEDIAEINEELAPTSGTCGVMGTASTMACVLVALGLMPFDGATAPAVSSARLRVAERTGAAAALAAKASEKSFYRPQSFLTKESFYNAITVLQAIGGSTNAVVHLMAIVNRHPALAGTEAVTLKTFDEIGRKTPLLIDLKPSGDNYMNDFHNAGGMLALLHELEPLLHLNAMTLSGKTLGEELASKPFKKFQFSSQIVRPLSDPLYPSSALAVLYGNLAPGGAVIKASASKDRRLLEYSGPAVVFENTEDLSRRIDRDDLDVTPNSVLVLKNIGPIGNPGMPEAGVIPIPRKLRGTNTTDMLRLSDGRMSGTAGGTIVLHISPETAIPGSPFRLVRSGDIIKMSLEKRSLNVDIPDEELARRKAEDEQKSAVAETGKGNARHRKKQRGYRGLYEASVNQAQYGADFDFLTANGAI